MNKNRPYSFLLGLTILVGILHYAGVYLYFYWRISGYDKVVHVLAGFLLTFMCCLLFYFKRAPRVSRSQLIIFGLLASLSIGLAWEVFELWAGITSLAQADYFVNNGGDIVADVVGGIGAVGYFIKKYHIQKI
jgi:hypothetical protein